MYTKGTAGYACSESLVTLTGTNSIAETNPLYASVDSVGCATPVITQSDFPYVLTTSAAPTAFQWYNTTAQRAFVNAQAIEAKPTVGFLASSLIKSLGTNDYYVFPGMSIQTAINTANAGATIHVGPGTYNEAVTINKPNLTIQSTDGRDTTIINSPNGTLTTAVKVLANMGNTTVDGFTIQGFTEGGIIQGMAAATGTTFHVLNNKVIPAGSYLRNGIQVSGNGSTVIGNYVVGARLTEDWGSTGIMVVNGSNITVENNEIMGGDGGTDYGVEVLNYNGPAIMENIIVRNNTIDKADYPLDVYAYAGKTVTNVTFEFNIVTNYLAGVSAAVNAETGVIGTVDASPNWFGSIAGPSAVELTAGTVNYAPWCANVGCTEFLPEEGQNLFIPSGTTPADVQTFIHNAPAGTVLVIPPGIAARGGGYLIDTPHLTIMIGKNARIQNESSCFTVAASHTIITTEDMATGVCVPTDNSDGIVVNAGLEDVRIIGIEFDGTAQDTGDGVHFNGAITDFQIVDNYFHDLDGSGIEFGEIITNNLGIQGNLFKNNGDLAIISAVDVDAQFNNWNSLIQPGLTHVNTDNPTYAALNVTNSGTPWLSQVVSGQTITYTVTADLKNVTGAAFTLHYPANLTLVEPIVLGGIFSTENVTPATGKLVYQGYNLFPATPETGTGIVLFTATFTANATGSGAFTFDALTDSFTMAPTTGVAPSTNVYTNALANGTVNVITLPTLTWVDAFPTYAVGIPQAFTLTVTNGTGGIFTPEISFTGAGITVTGDTTIGTLASGGVKVLNLTITFANPGAQSVVVNLT